MAIQGGDTDIRDIRDIVDRVLPARPTAMDPKVAQAEVTPATREYHRRDIPTHRQDSLITLAHLHQEVPDLVLPTRRAMDPPVLVDLLPLVVGHPHPLLVGPPQDQGRPLPLPPQLMSQ
jgi:hypothetical protein